MINNTVQPMPGRVDNEALPKIKEPWEKSGSCYQKIFLQFGVPFLVFGHTHVFRGIVPKNMCMTKGQQWNQKLKKKNLVAGATFSPRFLYFW